MKERIYPFFLPEEADQVLTLLTSSQNSESKIGQQRKGGHT